MNDRISKCIAELPAGEWDYRSFKDLVVFACPQHPPYILHNGELKPLTFKDNPEPCEFWLDRRFYVA